MISEDEEVEEEELLRQAIAMSLEEAGGDRRATGGLYSWIIR